MKNSCVILVVTHKEYRMPENPLYHPIQVGTGAKLHEAWLRDNTGENICEKNPTFCELTALYWAWKNLDADILGLCHYRRYLGSPGKRGARTDAFLTEADILKLLKQSAQDTGVDILLPGKRHYWIETRESQYAHAHHREDLECVEGILKERYPEYMEAWNQMLKSRSGHICNMFVMRKDLLDAYCTWLFDILLEAERRLDISSYTGNSRRVFGFLGERLLDVWIERNGCTWKEVPMINLESQHWVRKGLDFIRRKWKGNR